MRRLALFIAALMPAVLPAQADAEVPNLIAIAQQLATGRFKGLIYGPGKEKPPQSIDCTGFLLEVVKEMATQSGVTLSSPTKNAVSLANVPKESVQQLVEKGDPKISGVQAALVDAKLGEVIKPEDAKPGDMVQYWYKLKDGKWEGHAAIVKLVTGKSTATGSTVQITLFGAHHERLEKRADEDASIPVNKGGIGDSKQLNWTEKKVFLVRWTKTLAKKPEKPAGK